jgi:tetratricopeptide (TPR) repeat protein
LEDAEIKCEEYFQEAMKNDIGLPEATQSLATLRLAQQKKEQAIELLEETYRRLVECDEHTMPSLDFRIQSGKLLMEIEKFEEASDILESVLQEDDENAEVWFLVGKCYRFLEDFENSLEFFEKCQELLVQLKKQQQQHFYLHDQFKQVETNISELKHFLSKQQTSLLPMIEKEQEETDEDMKD